MDYIDVRSTLNPEAGTLRVHPSSTREEVTQWVESLPGVGHKDLDRLFAHLVAEHLHTATLNPWLSWFILDDMREAIDGYGLTVDVYQGGNLLRSVTGESLRRDGEATAALRDRLQK